MSTILWPGVGSSRPARVKRVHLAPELEQMADMEPPHRQVADVADDPAQGLPVALNRRGGPPHLVSGPVKKGRRYGTDREAPADLLFGLTVFGSVLLGIIVIGAERAGLTVL